MAGRNFILLGACAFLVAASAASAQLTQWSIRGSVTSVISSGTPSAWTSGIGVGTDFELRLLLDTVPTVLDSDPWYGFAEYRAINASLRLGTTFLDLDYLEPFWIGYADVGPVAGSGAYFGGANLLNQASCGLELWYNGTTDFVLPSDFAASGYDLDWIWDVWRRVVVTNVVEGGEWAAFATVQAVSATPVPEPAAFGLFGAVVLAGFIAVRCRHRRRLVGLSRAA